MPVTFTVFHVSKGKRLAALKSFGLLRSGLHKVPGLCFGKAMGCGRGAVFSIRPDWDRWCLMTVWERWEHCAAFCNDTLYKNLAACASYQDAFLLETITVKGAWDGSNPFVSGTQQDTWSGKPLAVLTRANIHPLRIPGFIRHSRLAAHSLEKMNGLTYSLGMGELPLIRQATFSVWESEAAMKAFAYKDEAHIAAMRAKAQKGYFTEELFARFALLQTAGDLRELARRY